MRMADCCFIFCAGRRSRGQTAFPSSASCTPWSVCPRECTDVVPPNSSPHHPQRMIVRVHGHPPDRWSDPEPAGAARLAHRDIFVLDITHLAEGPHAIEVDLPHLSRRE